MIRRAGDGVVTPKLIYFAKRHPRFDPAGFRERWRQHGRLGMSLPRWKNVLRYAQYDPLEGIEAGWPADCDGVATVVFRSEETRLAHGADSGAAITRADEKETFARPVKSFSMLTNETVIAPHLGAGSRLFARLFRTADADAAGFSQWLAREWAPRLHAALRAIDGEAGLSLNIARADSRSIGLGLDADCVVEISSDRMAEIAAMLRRETLNVGFRRHVGRHDALATSEHLLHGH